jgi:hypothetical protein
MTAVQAFPVHTLRERLCSLCSPRYRDSLVHRANLLNRWAGTRNVSLSIALKEESYVDRSEGVCVLYVCRV